MSYKQMTGNIISATKVEPAGKVENSAASGVWNLQDQYDYRRGNNWPSTDNPVPTAMIAGGASASATAGTNIIDSIAIASTGNATDFGDLTVVRYNTAAGTIASTTRGVFAGGYDNSNSLNTIDYITIASAGNATDFGNLSTGTRVPGAFSSATRGVIVGGATDAANQVNTIEYITIGSTGNATDFGDITTALGGVGGLASTTRGINAGGNNQGNGTNVIEYVTIANTGNATDFGNLLAGIGELCCLSSNVRGIVAGGVGVDGSGNLAYGQLQYITIASTGNATDFGDMTVESNARLQPCGISNPTRGVIAGGASNNGQNYSNVMQYVTIASAGDTTDFGDLTVGRFGVAGCSGSHGGIAA